MKGCKFYFRRGNENCNVAEAIARDCFACTVGSDRTRTSLGTSTSRLSVRLMRCRSERGANKIESSSYHSQMNIFIVKGLRKCHKKHLCVD